MQTFTMWMRVQENSALHSKVFSVLAEESAKTAITNKDFINLTTYVGNGKWKVCRDDCRFCQAWGVCLFLILMKLSKKTGNGAHCLWHQGGD